jgi:ribosomal protein S18 acetylase RimI-like enzyme
VKRSSHRGKASSVVCRTLTLPEVQRLPRIPSVYETEHVFRMSRLPDSQEIGWRLHEERLPRPFTKVYDDGEVDDWLDSYQESAGPDTIRFIGAFDGSDSVGLATWTHSKWNDTVWLADIRVKQDRIRQGVGSYLMTAVKAEAVGARVRGIRVETQITNYPAIQFYRRHGFVPSGLDDHLYSNQDPAQLEVALFLFWERV